MDTYRAGGYDPTKPNNNLLERWDDAARVFTDYRTTPATSRPYTAQEGAQADARAAADVALTARTATRAAVRAIVVDLKAEQDRCDVVLAKTNATITGADTKDVARAAKRIAAAAIDLARFVQDQT